MSFQVVIEPQADDDIDRNAQWWAKEHSPDQALVWYDTVYSQLRSLSEFPMRHPLAPENDLFPFEIRQKPVGLGSRKGYRAIFEIDGNVVRVLTIRDGAQDALTPDDLS